MAWYGELAPRILPRPSSAPAGGLVQAPALHSPLPTPLDSGLRRNDDPGDSWDPEALSKPRPVIFVPMTNMRFADYRNGLGGLIVSTNCLSA